MGACHRYLTSMSTRYRYRCLSFRMMFTLAMLLAVVFVYKYWTNRQQVKLSDDAVHDDIDVLMGEVVRKLNLQRPVKDQCFIPHLKSSDKLRLLPSNQSCQRIHPIRGSCQLAEELFFSSPTETCSHQEFYSICEYEERKNAVKCYNDICDPKSQVSIATIQEHLGILRWQDFPTISKLQAFITNLTDVRNRFQHHGFVFIKCRKLFNNNDMDSDDEIADDSNYEDNDDEAYEDDLILAGKEHLVGRYARQLMILPPKVTKHKAVHTNNYININVFLLDSVSRHHFFRSLPRTIEKFNELNNGNDSMVLDFELMQSLKGRTYENLLAFFTGQILDDKNQFGTQDLPPEPLRSEVLLKEFKKHGYETAWIEDLCWTWEWGIAKNLLALYPDLKLEERWHKFKEALQTAQIDRFDVALTSCEILRVNLHNDPFHGPDAVCYNGQYQHEYILQYLKLYHNAMDKIKQPFFNHVILNVAHEDSGRRVQTLDKNLADYIGQLSQQQNTITIMYADHGNAYGQFIEQTEEGRIEMFNPFLFIIVPKTVAKMLGPEKMAALKHNQHRLISILDLHYMVKSMIPQNKNQQVDPRSKKYALHPHGLFKHIPEDRTCNSIPRLQPNLCICQGYDSKVHNNTNNAILAEFALGQLNNAIQEQYQSSHSSKTRHGSCRRLVATRFDNVRESHQEDNVVITKMDLYIPNELNAKKTEEMFYVIVQSSVDKDNGMTLLSYERTSSYSQYGQCSDKGVNIDLCICSFNKPVKKFNTPKIDLDHPSPVFGHNTTVKEVHNKCLFFFERQNNAGGVIEVANVCHKVKYTVTFNMEVSHMIISRSLPAKEELLPGQVKFLIAMVQTRTHLDWKWTYKASFSWKDI
ncbi:uncharacterized protein LOC144438130 [Glandiceps talaboti]